MCVRVSAYPWVCLSIMDHVIVAAICHLVSLHFPAVHTTFHERLSLYDGQYDDRAQVRGRARRMCVGGRACVWLRARCVCVCVCVFARACSCACVCLCVFMRVLV